MRSELLFMAMAFGSLGGLLACGDKDDSTEDGGTTDSGSTDGGAGDGGGTDGGTDGGGGDGGGGDGGGGGSIDCSTAVWSELSGADRGTYMNDCVMPVMKPLFQSFDATEFASFSCANCHGSDFNGGTYAMPNTVFLDWANSGSWPAGYQEFMAMQVMPQMATLLGQTIFNPETNPEGFQCNSCHK